MSFVLISVKQQAHQVIKLPHTLCVTTLFLRNCAVSQTVYVSMQTTTHTQFAIQARLSYYHKRMHT